MNPDTLIWVCLPQRVDVLSGSTTLHLAVAIQPQLQSSTLGAAGLAGWPPRELAGAMLQADIGATVDAVHTLSGTVQLVANPALWPVLFPPTTPVASSVQGAGDTRTLMVDPTASQARAAREVFEAAAAVHVPADGDGVVAMANLHRTVGAALAASPFTRAARDAAACYRKRLVPIAPRTAASPVLAEAPVDPTHEFHRTVAFMREHPVAMRALGLVFDVSIVVPAATELANAGVVRLRWTEAPHGIPAIVSPWTAYELNLESRKWLPQSTAAISAGMLAISDEANADGVREWSLATLDVDLAVERLGRAADGMEREPDAAPVGFPALRTGGISLLHGAREGHHAARRVRRVAQGAMDPAAMTLTADDLVLGYRVDVRRGDGAWRSLCKRLATYTLGDAQAVGPANAPEEGNVKAHAAVDDGNGWTLDTDEVVARWQGWSLALAQPRFDVGDGGTGNADAVRPGRLAWTYAAPPSELPRLRFAEKYQLRVRIADLSGGGLTVGDPLSDRCATAPTLYERYEPVVAPAVLLPDSTSPNALGPGESAEEIVLRSDRGMTPTQFAAAYPLIPVSLERSVQPPRVPLAQIEQHSKLDKMSAAESWDIVRSAVAPADPARSLPLPDPAAAGVAAFHGRTLGAAQHLATWAWPSWPGVDAKRIRLAAGRTGDAPMVRWEPAPDGDTLVVSLAPGHALSVEISSTMQGGFEDQFAARQFLSVDAKLAAANGRHPMLTPARTVRLVHAVRKPLKDPAGLFKPTRQPGEAFATLTPVPAVLGLDTPSTARVDVVASWTEFVDDVQVAVPKMRVGGAALAPEGAEFDDPIRHEFGDTRHRWVTYTAVAAGRHRQYFDPAGTGDNALFTAETPFAPVRVPSTAPPAAPVVLAAVPAFRWTDAPGAPPAGGPAAGRVTLLSRRRESLVRIVLDRPWFSSGEGEQLAVIVAADLPVTAEHRTMVTEVGRDPLWQTAVPVRWPGHGDLAGAAADPVRCRLGAPAVDVVAVPYDVWFESGRWHADVELILSTPSYCPLARLAVARYQTHSLGGLTLSPVVQAPFVPVLPERVLTVERDGSTLYVSLEGIAATGPTPNRVSALLERCSGATSGSTDLSAGDAGDNISSLWRPLEAAIGHAQDEQDYGSELTVTLPDTTDALRLVVREFETIETGDTGQVAAPAELRRRVVFLAVEPVQSGR